RRGGDLLRRQIQVALVGGPLLEPLHSERVDLAGRLETHQRRRHHRHLLAAGQRWPGGQRLVRRGGRRVERAPLLTGRQRLSLRRPLHVSGQAVQERPEDGGVQALIRGEIELDFVRESRKRPGPFNSTNGLQVLVDWVGRHRIPPPVPDYSSSPMLIDWVCLMKTRALFSQSATVSSDTPSLGSNSVCSS